MNSHSSHKLIDALKRLLTQQPIEVRKYYCLTLTADHEGKLWTSVYSKFAGYSSGTPQFELRRPSHVQPENTRSSLEQINEPAFMVNDLDDAVAFVLIGGHAIINTEIAVTLFPHALTVENCASRSKAGVHRSNGRSALKVCQASSSLDEEACSGTRWGKMLHLWEGSGGWR